MNKIPFDINLSKAGRKAVTVEDDDVIIVQYDSMIRPGFPIIAASTASQTGDFSNIDFYKIDGTRAAGFIFSTDLRLLEEAPLHSFDNIIARNPSCPWEMNIFSTLVPPKEIREQLKKGTMYDPPIYAKGMIDNREYQEYHLFEPWMEKYIGTKIPYSQWKIYGNTL